MLNVLGRLRTQGKIFNTCRTSVPHYLCIGDQTVLGEAAQKSREVRPFSGVSSTEQTRTDQIGMEEEERPSYAKNDLGSRAQ